MADPKANPDWLSDLRAFFGGIDREDRDFAEHVERAARFLTEVAHPALETAGQALAQHGRKYETGGDTGRSYIIVRGADDKVEFQYAVVAEVMIEGITPYAHCWYESAPSAAAQNALESHEERSGKVHSPHDNASDNQTRGGGEQSDGAGKGGGEGEEDPGEKSAHGPKRIKTVEPLPGWTAHSDLGSVTYDTIASDFLEHYKQALLQSRAHLHAGQPYEAPRRPPDA